MNTIINRSMIQFRIDTSSDDCSPKWSKSETFFSIAGRRERGAPLVSARLNNQCQWNVVGLRFIRLLSLVRWLPVQRTGTEWNGRLMNASQNVPSIIYIHFLSLSLSRAVPVSWTRTNGHFFLCAEFFLYAIATVMRSFILFVDVVVVLVDILMGLGGGRPPPRYFVLGVREGSSPPSLHCCQHGGRPDIEFRPTTSAWARNGPLLFL